jgi:hypothetical protein
MQFTEVGGLDLLGFVDRPDGKVEVHVSVSDPPPRQTRDGHRRRGRDVGALTDPGIPIPDAGAGANGELRPGQVPPGGPHDPPLYGGEDEEERVPTAGGLQPVFVDARSVRITGRDQGGKNFEARLYGPGRSAEGETDREGWPGTGDRQGLMHGGANDYLPQRLGQFQRMLNRHYAK